MDDNDESYMIIDYQDEFKLIRIIDNNIVASNVQIEAELIPGDKLEPGDFEIAITKCKFWLENVVSRCVAFQKDNDFAKNFLLDKQGDHKCANNIMLTPLEPTDDHVAILIQSKLTALSSGSIFFDSMRVKCDNSSGIMFRFIGDTDDFLPEMCDWVKGKNWFDAPWWNRDDASTFDLKPPKNTDFNVKPSWAFDLNFLEKSYRPSEAVVIKTDFKPSIIKGGKEDE